MKHSVKDGIIMVLAVHPDDMPEDIWRDFLGTNYAVAMVRIGDDGKAEIRPEVEKGIRAVKSAVMLCKSDSFQEWVMPAMGEAWDPTDPEAGARGYILIRAGIESRSELKNNKEARELYYAMRSEYMERNNG